MKNHLMPRHEVSIVSALMVVLAIAFVGFANAGCGDNEPTLSEFVEDLAESTCTRQIRCGWTELEQKECEMQVHEYLCSSYDCTRKYTPTEAEIECVATYPDVACETTQHVCTVGGM